MAAAPQKDAPQLYLITPVGVHASELEPLLTLVMDRVTPACLRIPGTGDEAELGRIADLVRDIAHRRDIAVVIEDHVALALRHGLDGVHLTDGARTVRYARKELGADAIIGAYCATSRHDGMSAGEGGADYVAFGPVGDTALGRGAAVELDLFEWWSEVIEVPVVAEGAITADIAGQLAPITDFIAIGPEIWGQDDPASALADLWAAVTGAEAR